MGLQDTVTPPPATHPNIPFLPPTNHPTTSEVDQMINSRIAAALDQMRLESNQKQARQNVYRNVALGVGGFAVGVGGSMIVGRIVRGRRARAAGGSTTR